jgi:hypothetical protein
MSITVSGFIAIADSGAMAIAGDGRLRTVTIVPNRH